MLSSALSLSLAMQVRCTASQRGELRDLAAIFRADILDISANTLTIEILGKEDKMKALTDLLEPYGGASTLGMRALEGRSQRTISRPNPAAQPSQSINPLKVTPAAYALRLLQCRHPRDRADRARGSAARVGRGQQVPGERAVAEDLLKSGRSAPHRPRVRAGNTFRCKAPEGAYL
jgi:hypothetical protein